MPINENKLYIRVTADFDVKFSEWAKRMGLTKSQFGNMCVQAGLNQIIQAVSPIEAISPEQMIAIIQAAQKRGIDVDLSDFQKKGG